MSSIRIATLFLIGLTVVAVAQAPRVAVDAVAVMPADTFAAGPPSGAFRTPERAGRPEFASQPVQGFSSIRPVAHGDADWLALIDNGFGTRVNSPDSLLRMYRVTTLWAKGTVAPPESFVQLSDPNGLLPFHIVRSDTRERWLTGGDLDPESFVRMPDSSFWVGDEFGPFLVHLDPRGRVIAAPVEAPGMRSPDFPGALPPDAGQASSAQIRRSRGFEGLAANAGHTLLYAALEAGPLSDPAGTTRILEFDPALARWTGRWWRYQLDSPDHGLTELVGLGEVFGPRCDGRFLAIERDNGQGETAMFKRVFEVTFGPAVDGVSMPLPVELRLVADLLDIDNPLRLGGSARRFTFPYITTEAVWPVGPQTLVLVNDNNYPSGGGRGPEEDATEFIRLRLPSPLCER